MRLAELGANPAAGGNTAWIVVCCPGHQTRPKALQESDRLQRGTIALIVFVLGSAIIVTLLLGGPHRRSLGVTP
jgi:hypothetical protein